MPVPIATLVHDCRGPPLLAVALHHGHWVRPDVRKLLAVSEQERLREEDPYVGDWTAIAPSRAVARRSRFEVDLNRPPADAVYQTPEQSWGLAVWREPPPREVVDRSLSEHEQFYDALGRTLDLLLSRHRRLLVLDLHSYNHRRGGLDAPPAPPEENPEINIGSGSLDHHKWGPVVQAFMDSLRSFDYGGRRLDVRENVRFRGGYMARWIHERFPDACVPAIEVKKFFMDEWSGELDARQFRLLGAALSAAAQRACRALEALP